MALEREREFFESHKADLLDRFKDQYVLIKGSEVIGAFADAESAYASGVERFGLSAFLVKQVLDKEPVVLLPALSVARPDAGL
jgi:hypothetical protein